MKNSVLLDAGPLVASVDRRDRFHEWAKSQLAGMRPPLLTCEPVLAESCFLLRELRGGGRAILELIVRKIIRVPFRVDEHAESLAKLLERYSNVPMSLADACLVRMSEMDERSVVFTIDHDFKFYRRYGRQVIPTLMPPGWPPGRPGAPPPKR